MKASTSRPITWFTSLSEKVPRQQIFRYDAYHFSNEPTIIAVTSLFTRLSPRGITTLIKILPGNEKFLYHRRRREEEKGGKGIEVVSAAIGGREKEGRVER